MKVPEIKIYRKELFPFSYRRVIICDDGNEIRKSVQYHFSVYPITLKVESTGIPSGSISLSIFRFNIEARLSW